MLFIKSVVDLHLFKCGSPPPRIQLLSQCESGSVSREPSIQIRIYITDKNGKDSEPGPLFLKSVVDLHLFKCGSPPGSSFYLNVDPDPYPGSQASKSGSTSLIKMGRILSRARSF
jgi:hypothetical protein